MIDVFLLSKETRVILRGNCQSELERNPFIKVVPLTSLVSLDRMYSVCVQMPDSPVLSQIRRSEVSAWPDFTEEMQAEPLVTRAALNHQQKKAVTGFTSAQQGVYLLKGPPGTGKTTTIVSMLEEITAGEDCRTLVCAPSNKAVQVLAERALEKMPDAPILLVGVPGKISPKLMEIFLDNWVIRYPKRLKEILLKFEVTQLLSKLISEGRVNFQSLNDSIDQLEATAAEIKNILSICLRYALILTEEIRLEMKEAAAHSLSCYIALLHSLRSGAAMAAFPALGLKAAAQIQERQASSLNVPEITLKLWQEYTRSNQIILEKILQHVPQDQNTLLLRAGILFCTLSISGRVGLQRQCAQQDPFQAIIIDEAGQSIEAETLIPFSLAPRAKKVLIVGDTRQLPATTISRSSKQTHFEWSMMWRLLEENHQPSHLLAVQYRMRGNISHFPSRRYYEGTLLNHELIPGRMCHSRHFVGPHGYKIWVDTAGQEERERDGTSYRNHAEATSVLQIIRAIRERDTKSHIGVISFYGAQVRGIGHLLSQEKARNPKIGQHNITVSTVDGFQGDEKDIIIISFVRANNSSEIGFLHDFRRLNVAITRAKDALIIVGSASTFKEVRGSEMQELLSFCEEAGTVCSLDRALQTIHQGVAPQTVMGHSLPEVHPIRNVSSAVGKKRNPVPPARTTQAEINKLFTEKELMEQAQRYSGKAQYDAAIENCKVVLERTPSRPDIYRFIAGCYKASNDLTNALMMEEVAETLERELAQFAQDAAQGKSAAVLHPPVNVVPAGFSLVEPRRKNIVKRLEMARDLSNQRRFAEAAQAYTDLLDEARGNSEVLLGLGWCLHKQRKHEEAARYFQLSIDIDPCPLAYQGLIQCKEFSNQIEWALDLACECLEYFPWAKTIHAIKERLEEKSETAIRMKKSFVGARVNPSQTAFGNFALATKASAAVAPPQAARGFMSAEDFPKLERSTLTQPQVAATHFFAAATSSNGEGKKPAALMQSRPAAAAFTKAGAQSALEETIKIARQCSEAGNYSEAEAIYRRLLVQHPANSEVILGVGLSLNRQRANKEAIPYLLDALKLKRTTLVYQELIIAYKHSADFEQASRYLNEGLRSFPSAPGLLKFKEELGKIKKTTEQQKTIQKPMAAARSADIFNLADVLTKARAACEGGRLDDSLLLYRTALGHAPKNLDVLLGFAWVYNKQQSYEEAVFYFKESLLVKSTDAIQYYGLAIALRGFHDLIGARAAIDQALKINPKHPPILALKKKISEEMSAESTRSRGLTLGAFFTAPSYAVGRGAVAAAAAAAGSAPVFKQ